MTHALKKVSLMHKCSLILFYTFRSSIRSSVCQQNLNLWHLSLYQTIPTLSTLERGLLETLWEKEKMLVSSIFSFSHNVFYPSQNIFQNFNHISIFVCKRFQFRQVYNFVVSYSDNNSKSAGEGLKSRKGYNGSWIGYIITWNVSLCKQR